jgi:hypothetical protein
LAAASGLGEAAFVARFGYLVSDEGPASASVRK